MRTLAAAYVNGLGIFFLVSYSAACFAQSVIPTSGATQFRSIIESDAIQLPNQIYQARPNMVTGPRFDLELPDGLSCSSSNGTPPSLNFYGGSSVRDNSYQGFQDFVTGGHSIGAVLSLPLARTSSPRCDEAYNLYLTSKKVELLSTLYDSGALSDDQLQVLIIKSLKELGLDVDEPLDSSLPSAESSDTPLTVEPFVVGP